MKYKVLKWGWYDKGEIVDLEVLDYGEDIVSYRLAGKEGALLNFVDKAGREEFDKMFQKLGQEA